MRSLFNMLVDMYRENNQHPSKATIRYFKRLNKVNKRDCASFKRSNLRFKKALNALRKIQPSN